jgi:hypothetical protein
LLVGHDVHTVTQMGWTRLGNGVLIRQAAAEFDALLTADQNIEFQQNLKTLPMSVVVLVANSNRLDSLEHRSILLPIEVPGCRVYRNE